MRKNKKYKEIRVDNELDSMIQQALDILNKNQAGIEIDLPSFRRMAYTNFSKSIISRAKDVSGTNGDTRRTSHLKDVHFSLL